MVGLSIVRAETSGGKEDIHKHITLTAALIKSPPRETEGRASETYKEIMRHTYIQVKDNKIPSALLI
jgi:hypothetical protein